MTMPRLTPQSWHEAGYHVTGLRCWTGQQCHQTCHPIEHLWYHLKERLATYEVIPSNLKELWERVQNELDKITSYTCRELTDSMPARIAEVIQRRGGYTSY